MSTAHDQALARAFDGQAAKFERAPVQSDPAALARLAAFSDLPQDSLVLDTGCGPGLVAEAFLKAGHRILGVDLSDEMIARARARCAHFGDRAFFHQGSLYEILPGGPFDAVVSRYVLHHVADPHAFVTRQTNLIRRGGVVILCDHTTDPRPVAAALHRRLEIGRDGTHTTNLTPGAIVDLFAACGLVDIRHEEDAFTLDFDEWFDRGTPAMPKADVRDALIGCRGIRGFDPAARPDGGITIACYRSLVRGTKPGPTP